MRIRSQLFILVVAALAPVALLAGFLTLQLWQAQSRAYQERYQERVAALRIALDAQIDAYVRTLEALAAAPELQAPPASAALAARMEVPLRANPGWVAVGLQDPEGRLLTLVGGDPADRGLHLDAATAAAARQSGRVAISNGVPDGTQRLMTFIALPVARGDGPGTLLYAAIEHQAWLELLRRFPLPENATLTLNDRNGVIIARTLNDPQWVGKPSVPDYWQRTVGRDEGTMVNRGLEGQVFDTAFSRLRSAGWVLGTGVPRSELEEALRGMTSLIAAGIVLALGAALALAVLFGRRIDAALTALAAYARAVGEGRPVAAGARLSIDEAETVRGVMRDAAALLDARTRSLSQAVAAAQEATRSKDEARAAAEAARTQMELALSSIDDQFFVLDRALHYTLVNRRAAEWLRRPAADLLGQPILEVFPGIRGGAFEAALRAALEDGQSRRFEAEYPGAQRCYAHALYPLATGIAVLLVDVTERKRAEADSRRHVERLHFLDDLSESLQTLYEPYDVMSVTTWKLAQFLGASRCAYAEAGADDGGGEFEVQREWMESAADLAHPLLRDAAAGSALRQGFTQRGADGSMIACPLLRDGRTAAVLVVERRAAPPFDAGEQSLIEAVADRAWAHFERIRFAAQLRLADRRKDEFLATLAHELRNPLAPIRAAAQILRRIDTGGAEARWARDVIERQVGHLTRLIDDLLDVSRITNNKLALKRERLPLATVLGAAVEACQPLLAERGQQLQFEPPAPALTVDGDAVRLTQVFTNLLNNASKYTEPGGVIRLSAGATDDGGVEVAVEDNGIGITPAQLPRLFDLFFQADQSLERSRSGLGIGLSLAQLLVRLHGGRIEAHSAGPGCGSRFTVGLPRALPEAPAAVTVAAPAVAPDDAPRTGARLLVVDDSRDAADSLALLLELHGYRVEVAYDGRHALAVVERSRPQAVILDIGMPGLNGYELCRALRARPGGAELLLVAVSGYGSDDPQHPWREAGFDARFTKPVDPAALHRLLSERLAVPAAGDR